MDQSRRIAIGTLIVASAVCGVLAALAQSEILAMLAAGCATFTIVAGFSAVADQGTSRTSAVQVGYGPTTSATVDIIDPPRPMVFEPTDYSVESVPPPPPLAGHVFELPVPEPTAPTPSAAPCSTLRMPAGIDPRDVVSALLIAGQAAGRPIAAHLWLEDSVTDTLRLVEAQGETKPHPLPVGMATGLLGGSLATKTAHLGPIESADVDEHHWRYAIPLAGTDPRGVAAIDFEGAAEPDRATLTTISAALRGALSGALALHVARLEGETARVLVETCAALARVLDPDDVLHTALDHAMELASAQTGSIMILDPETRRMRIAVARGLPETIVENTDIAEGDGIAGWVLTSKQPLVIEDLKEVGVRSRRHGIRSAVCIPLADDEGIVGVLNVGSNSFLPRISKSHLQTLEALGRTIVAALRNAWQSEGAEDLYFDTLKTLAIALEARNPYARGGVVRVVELTDALCIYLGISKEEAKALRIAAMLHDVGMSAVGTSAPVTAGSLSTVEWGMLKMHPIIAAEIMSEAPALDSVIPIVYHHHEHFDGSGYVDGLAGEDIPRGARILAVVDAYVSMTSARPYRATLTHAQAVSELNRLAGAQFDPRIVRAFIEIVAQPGQEGILGS